MKIEFNFVVVFCMKISMAFITCAPHLTKSATCGLLTAALFFILKDQEHRIYAKHFNAIAKLYCEHLLFSSAL